MPKIFGTNIVGILAATLVFYIVGILIYGVLFSDEWMELSGISQEDAEAHAKALGPLVMYGGGFLITLMQVIGLSYVFNYARASHWTTCAKISAGIAVLIALPVLMYNFLYGGFQLKAIGLDFAHLMIGYVLASVIMSFFRGQDEIKSA